MRVSERQLFVVVVVGDHGGYWWRARGECTVNLNTEDLYFSNAAHIPCLCGAPTLHILIFFCRSARQVPGLVIS